MLVRRPWNFYEFFSLSLFSFNSVSLRPPDEALRPPPDARSVILPSQRTALPPAARNLSFVEDTVHGLRSSVSPVLRLLRRPEWKTTVSPRGNVKAKAWSEEPWRRR